MFGCSAAVLDERFESRSIVGIAFCLLLPTCHQVFPFFAATESPEENRRQMSFQIIQIVADQLVSVYFTLGNNVIDRSI